MAQWTTKTKKFLYDANSKLFEPPPLYLKEIPLKFNTYDQYKEIFYPLLLEETREIIKNSILEKIGELTLILIAYFQLFFF